MTKRSVSATLDPSDDGKDLERALARGGAFDVLVHDPLGRGSGYFDVQETPDDGVLKVTDARRRRFAYVERVGSRVGWYDGDDEGVTPEYVYYGLRAHTVEILEADGNGRPTRVREIRSARVRPVRRPPSAGGEGPVEGPSE